ncbi:MAG: hypothetical protein ACD_62C00135G0007 [uncultured bacterium]|nr:MAG: hypothetical protein ACD_62C00135G0007 [uncultured bacterium]
MNRTVQIIVYVFTLVVAFVGFVVLLFPLDTVIGHFLAQVEEDTAGKYRVVVADIDGSLIFDSHFKNFRVYQQGREILSVPELDVGFSLFSLLGDNKTVGFDAVFEKGEVSGKVALSTKGKQIGLKMIDVGFENFATDQLRFIEDYLASAKMPLSFSGVLDGTVSVSLEDDHRASEVDVKLKISQALLGAIPINQEQYSCEAIEEAVLAEGQTGIELEIGLSNAKIMVNRFFIPGPDIKLTDFTGSAHISRVYDVMRMSFDGKVLFSEKSTEKCLALRSEEPLNLVVRGSINKPNVTLGGIPLVQ